VSSNSNRSSLCRVEGRAQSPREQILERTRRERDARRQKKVENGAAVVIQSAWRAFASRELSRQVWREKICSGQTARTGSTRKFLRVLVASVDPWRLDDVEKLCSALDDADVGEMLKVVTSARVSVPDAEEEGPWMDFILVRNIFQLCFRSLSLQRCLFDQFASLPLFELQQTQRPDGDRRKILWMTKTLVEFILSILSTRNVSFLGISRQAPCLWQFVLSWDSAAGEWRRIRQPCIFQDLANFQFRRAIPNCAPAAETILIASLVCLFSADAYRKDPGIFASEILQILQIDSLLQKCPSIVPLVGKMWSSAACCIRWHPGLGSVLQKVVPLQSMEALMENLVQCLEHMQNSGNLSSTSARDSLLACTAFMDTVLEDSAHWQVSAEKFVYPLAEANVIVSITKVLEDQEIAGDRSVELVCSFLNRILVYSSSPLVQTKITLTLAVKANLAGILWHTYLNKYDVASMSEEAWISMIPVMVLFCETFATSLNVVGDAGFYNRGHPVPVEEVYNETKSVLMLLKDVLWRIVWKESGHADASSRLLKSAGKLFMLLHERNGRRPFAPNEAFYASNLPKESFHTAAVTAVGRGDIERMHIDISGVDGGDVSDDEELDGNLHPKSRVVNILQYAYPLVPFKERVRVFQSVVFAERLAIGAEESMTGVFFGGLSRDRFVTVRRGKVLNDAFDALGQHKRNVDVKKRIRISFVNEFGEQEAGIDGGGVFKEFLESVVRESVDLDKGLFCCTTDNKLYPSPLEGLAEAEVNKVNRLKMLEFVGMMIGKALWEGILLDLPLASFFLKKIRGATSGVDDLPSLDPEMARNLSFLVNNPDSVKDMGLTFSITEVNSSGATRDIELVPDGSSIPVTAANMAHFIHRVASFKLNEQIKYSCDAFYWVFMLSFRKNG
jgi:hypothetical protein